MPDPVSSRLAASNLSDQDDESLVCKPGPISGDASATASSSSGIVGPRAEGHVRSDDLYAGAFALKGRDPNSGIEVEVFSVSVHDGQTQADAQVGMARMGISSDDGHFNLRGEAFTAKAHLGTRNPDGSTGLNAGVGAVAVGAEGTATVGPVSVTIGASIGAVLSGSIGLRDGDRDGEPELCGRVEAGPWTLGACLERFW